MVILIIYINLYYNNYINSYFLYTLLCYYLNIHFLELFYSIFSITENRINRIIWKQNRINLSKFNHISDHTFIKFINQYALFIIVTCFIRLLLTLCQPAQNYFRLRSVFQFSSNFHAQNQHKLILIHFNRFKYSLYTTFIVLR